MTKTRRKYDREFKLSVIAELDSGKPLVQIARERGIHPSLPCRRKDELASNPEGAFRGNGQRYKEGARIDELEWLLGQLYAENELLKKALSVLEQSREENPGCVRLGNGSRHLTVKLISDHPGFAIDGSDEQIIEACRKHIGQMNLPANRASVPPLKKGDGCAWLMPHYPAQAFLPTRPSARL